MQFGEEMKASNDGNICTLVVTHYLVDGTLGSSKESMATVMIYYDSGAGFKFIRQSALPPNWESQVDDKAAPPRLYYANGRPLDRSDTVWFTKMFENTHYRVKFIISDRLAVDVIIGTTFLHRHVVTIL